MAKCLANLIWEHGVPLKIVYDGATEFLSDILQETATLLGITQLPTSGGYPQTDGQEKRMNGTLKQMLAVIGFVGRDCITYLLLNPPQNQYLKIEISYSAVYTI